MEFACVAAVAVWGMVQVLAAEPPIDANGVAELLAQCRTAMEEGRCYDAAGIAERAQQSARELGDSAAAVTARIFRTAGLELDDGFHEFNARTTRRLARRVTFDFRDTPLQDVVAFLQTITRMTIILESRSMAMLPEPKVTLKMTDARLGNALTEIIKPLGLQYRIADGAAYVGTPDNLPLEQIPCTITDAALQVKSPERIAGRFTGYMFAEHYRMVIVACSADGKLLIKLGPASIEHAEEIKSLADADIAALLAMSPPDWTIEVPQKLQQKVSFDFVETPLQDILQFAHGLMDMPMNVDAKALAELDNPEVTLKVTDMQLGQALDWTLKQVGMVYVTANGGILITNKEQLKNNPPPGYYDLSTVMVEVESIGDELKTIFSGHMNVDPHNGIWFVRCKDLEGREMKITGVMK